jgi:hypothetical protein
MSQNNTVLVPVEVEEEDPDKEDEEEWNEDEENEDEEKEDNEKDRQEKPLKFSWKYPVKEVIVGTQGTTICHPFINDSNYQDHTLLMLLLSKKNPFAATHGEKMKTQSEFLKLCQQAQNDMGAYPLKKLRQYSTVKMRIKEYASIDADSLEKNPSTGDRKLDHECKKDEGGEDPKDGGKVRLGVLIYRAIGSFLDVYQGWEAVQSRKKEADSKQMRKANMESQILRCAALKKLASKGNKGHEPATKMAKTLTNVEPYTTTTKKFVTPATMKKVTSPVNLASDDDGWNGAQLKALSDYDEAEMNKKQNAKCISTMKKRKEKSNDGEDDEDAAKAIMRQLSERSLAKEAAHKLHNERKLLEAQNRKKELEIKEQEQQNQNQQNQAHLQMMENIFDLLKEHAFKNEE